MRVVHIVVSPFGSDLGEVNRLLSEGWDIQAVVPAWDRDGIAKIIYIMVDNTGS